MKKGRILVVDDEIELCIILDKLFSKRGYDVRMAHSVTEAIALMEKEEFDLVLSDYVMPNGSGYDVAMFLNTLEKRPKIGLITGWGKLIGDNEKEKMKVSFVIRKPFDFSELIKQVNVTLNQN
ncbi:MAG: Sporulation initiation phosphotransferase F [Candidatus Scalindua arabica]|uniref:Sporulation initiation phosphotransferase F n=1 Tax=Candidatus Scalindua arabica TaxID=1127984 RepID=A0A941W460_9BACT|nr:Sporulation initiation phosphotransferase F [Candidatus Scalindua arabica]